MPLLIINEDYNGQNFLQSNAGEWIDSSIEISTRFSIGSGTSNKITYDGSGGIYRLTFDSADWQDEGFMVGDTIVLTYNWYNNPPPQQAQTFTSTITYISGNVLQMADPFGLTSPSFSTHANGRQFPTDGLASGILAVSTKTPENINFDFNLSVNGSTALNSVIDSELNRFESPNLNLLTTGGSMAMTQLINKSGGLLRNVTITKTYDEGSPTYWKRYRIDFKFWQWGVIKDGYTSDNPPYYDTSDCLSPVSRLTIFPQYGNPNGILKITNQTLQANTGGFDENLNGGLSAYSLIGTNFFDLLGDPITAVDYSNECTFVAVINAPNQDNTLSKYRIGMMWRPIDGSYYQNISTTDVGENLMVLSPEIDFIADGSTDATIYQGFTNPNGARWDFQNLKFELTGIDELTVSGKIIPNSQATTLFDGVPNGGRKTTIFVSIGNHLNDNTSLSERVSLKIFDDDNYDAPTKGVQINTSLVALYDHDGNDITDNTSPNTTTEDDVLFVSEFLLTKNKAYEGIKTEISAYNTVTEEYFVLETNTFSFANNQMIGGIIQLNSTVNRSFNLPPSTDRNIVRILNKNNLNTATQYGVKLDYGFLNDWRYWLEQSNVDNDFFDINEDFDGKNKNWQRFGASGSDWKLRLSYYTILDGVENFNHYLFEDRPYEDNPDITTTRQLTLLSDGSHPLNILANEIHEVEYTLVWSGSNYSAEWAEITIEDFESGNRWVISSVLPQGNIGSNPLKPIAGQDKLDLQIVGGNTAIAKCLLDSSILATNSVSLSVRIYSEDGFIADGKITTWGETKYTVSGDIKQLA